MDREGMAATLRENCDPEGKTSPPEGRGWREPLPARFPRARAGRSPWFRPPGRRGGPDSRLTSSSGAKPAAQLESSASGRAAAAMAPVPRPFRRAATTARGGGGGRSREGPGGERARPPLDALFPPPAVGRMVRPGRRVPLPGEAVPPWPERGRCGRVGSDSAGSGSSFPDRALLPWQRNRGTPGNPSAPQVILQHPGSVRRCC